MGGPLGGRKEGVARFAACPQAVGAQVTARAHLDDVAEAIRILAWAPEDERSRTAP